MDPMDLIQEFLTNELHGQEFRKLIMNNQFDSVIEKLPDEFKSAHPEFMFRLQLKHIASTAAQHDPLQVIQLVHRYVPFPNTVSQDHLQKIEQKLLLQLQTPDPPSNNDYNTEKNSKLAQQLNKLLLLHQQQGGNEISKLIVYHSLLDYFAISD